jgi:hypothetical protein
MNGRKLYVRPPTTAIVVSERPPPEEMGCQQPDAGRRR